MKRILVFLMLIICVFMYSCASTVDKIVSSENSDDASVLDNSSDSSSETPKIERINVAKGKKYDTIMIKGKYRDDVFGDGKTCERQKLTDGISAKESGGNADMVAGFPASEMGFTIDLGKKTDNLKSFSMDLYYGEWKINPPILVEYYISNDGKIFESIGTVSLRSAAPRNTSDGTWLARVFTLNLDKTVSARYVRFAVKAVNHIWSSEIQIFTGSNGDFVPEKPVVLDNGVSIVKIYVSSNINKDDYVGATLEVTDVTGVFNSIKDTQAKIKVRGNSTASGCKKPYNIVFCEKVNPLGIGKGKKFNLLANLYDKTLMRNKLSYDFAISLGLSNTSHSEFVDVYINDEYLGNYLLCEDVGVGKSKVDIDINNNEFLLEYEPWQGYSNPFSFITPRFNIVFGLNDRDMPTEEQENFLIKFFENAENALISKDIFKIKEYFDIDSFVNFYIANELFKNVDFQTSSTRFYIKNNKLYAGPMWDLDLSSGNANVDYYKHYFIDGDSVPGFYCLGIYSNALLECDEFHELVKSRYIEIQDKIINLTTDNALGKNVIDLILQRYEKSFIANYEVAGWSLTKIHCDYEIRTPFDTFSANVEFLRQWLIKRNEWLLENL